MIHIVEPNLKIVEVWDVCPADVHTQLSIAEQFEGILEDCFSYKEWLKARAGGFCDVDKFTGFEADNKETSDDAKEAVAAILRDLF